MSRTTEWDHECDCLHSCKTRLITHTVVTQRRSCQKWMADIHLCQCQCIPGLITEAENLIASVNVWHSVISLPEQCFAVGHTAAEIWGMFENRNNEFTEFFFPFPGLSHAAPLPQWLSLHCQVCEQMMPITHREERPRKPWCEKWR